MFLSLHTPHVNDGDTRLQEEEYDAGPNITPNLKLSSPDISKVINHRSEKPRWKYNPMLITLAAKQFRKTT